jgi:predicted PurR-regulated permease PerM
MLVFRLDFVLVASLFGGLFMLIPLMGGFLSLLPPLFVAPFEAPQIALGLVIALFIYQFIILNLVMPRLLSDSLGLHPLLVFAALLVGVKVAGFWGAFFGIPVAGVIWAMGKFFWDDWQRNEKLTSEPDR